MFDFLSEIMIIVSVCVREKSSESFHVINHWQGIVACGMLMACMSRELQERIDHGKRPTTEAASRACQCSESASQPQSVFLMDPWEAIYWTLPLTLYPLKIYGHINL